MNHPPTKTGDPRVNSPLYPHPQVNSYGAALRGRSATAHPQEGHPMYRVTVTPAPPRHEPSMCAWCVRPITSTTPYVNLRSGRTVHVSHLKGRS